MCEAYRESRCWITPLNRGVAGELIAMLETDPGYLAKKAQRDEPPRQPSPPLVTRLALAYITRRFARASF